MMAIIIADIVRFRKCSCFGVFLFMLALPTVYILVLPHRVNNSCPAGITKAEVSPSLFTPLSHHYRRVYSHHTKIYTVKKIIDNYLVRAGQT